MARLRVRNQYSMMAYLLVGRLQLHPPFPVRHPISIILTASDAFRSRLALLRIASSPHESPWAEFDFGGLDGGRASMAEGLLRWSFCV